MAAAAERVRGAVGRWHPQKARERVMRVERDAECRMQREWRCGGWCERESEGERGGVAGRGASAWLSEGLEVSVQRVVHLLEVAEAAQPQLLHELAAVCGDSKA